MIKKGFTERLIKKNYGQFHNISGLKQAAEARRSFKSGKRKSKGKIAVTSALGAAAGGVGSGILGGKMAGGVASPSKPVINFTKSGNSNRSRKTCSTAKQRLGKILGLKF